MRALSERHPDGTFHAWQVEAQSGQSARLHFMLQPMRREHSEHIGGAEQAAYQRFIASFYGS